MNLTPKDIKNKDRASGYDGVIVDHGGGFRPNPYRAENSYRGGRNAGTARGWRGPRRATALEAAQDRCDFLNAQATPATPVKLKTAGHPKAKSAPRSPKLSAALAVARDIERDERAAKNPRSKGWIYCVAEKGSKRAVKVGWTVKDPPQARMGDYQTGNPRLLIMLAVKPGRKRDETALHRKYITHNVLGEWFRPTRPLLSEFGLTKEDLA